MKLVNLRAPHVEGTLKAPVHGTDPTEWAVACAACHEVFPCPTRTVLTETIVKLEELGVHWWDGFPCQRCSQPMRQAGAITNGYLDLVCESCGSSSCCHVGDDWSTA